jgi:phage/conjugal plasmid C-4 type zinc finger TraR family protein
MAGGWTADGGVQDQIDATVDSEIERARSRLPKGESRLTCEDCEGPIPEGRRLAMPGVRRCVRCQTELDKADSDRSLFNRRGSKDSQLR